MKKISILFALLLFAGFTAISQSDTSAVKKVNNNKSVAGYFTFNDSKPERSPYASGYLIDNQTNVIPPAKSLEFVIQHRFGTMALPIQDWVSITASLTGCSLDSERPKSTNYRISV